MRSRTMAARRNDGHSSDEDNPIPSRQISQPSVNEADRDAELIPPAAYLENWSNNYYLDLEVEFRHPIIIEILKRHPIFTALTKVVAVPEIYLQQFWYSMEFVPTPEVSHQHFKSKIDHFAAKITLRRLRRALGLPHRAEFEDQILDTDLFRDIMSIGYNNPRPGRANLTSSSEFKKKFLPEEYYDLASIIIRCMTGKHTGIDGCNLLTLRMIHAVIFNRQIDYAVIIWNELVQLVSDKSHPQKARRFVPYRRFLAILIHEIMRTNRRIPRRERHPMAEMTWMRALQYPRYLPFPNYRPLPIQTVLIADQTSPIVQEYRRIHALMDQPEQADPTHGAALVGPSAVQEHGAPEQRGELRENVNERGTGVGGDVRSTGPLRIVIRRRRPESQGASTSGAVQAAAVESAPAFEAAATFGVLSQPIGSIPEERPPTDPREGGEDTQGGAGDDNNDEDDDQPRPDDMPVMSPVRTGPSTVASVPALTATVEVQTETGLDRTGDIRMEEGVTVEEIITVSRQEGEQKEREERVTGSTQGINQDPLLTIVSTPIPTQAIAVIHSTESLHSVVSPITGTETRPPTQSVLAGHDVSHPHTSSIIVHDSSLVPFGYTTTPRERTTQTIGSLSGTVVGTISGPTSTPVVQPPFTGAVQGSGGSPVVQIGTTGASPVVQTGPTVLLEPGVSSPPLTQPGYRRLRWDLPGMVSLPDGSVQYTFDPAGPNSILTREMVAKGLEILKKSFDVNAKSTDLHLRRLYDELKRLERGKAPAAADQPPTPTPAPRVPPPHQEPLTEEELKSQLYAHLLSRAHELNQEEADLMMLLRRQLEETHARCISRDDLTRATDSINNSINNLANIINSLSTNVNAALERLEQRVTILETTCRADAQGSKRRHDDQDDPDHHEGERSVRPRIELPGSTSHAAQTSAAQEGTQSGARQASQEQESQASGSEIGATEQASSFPSHELLPRAMSGTTVSGSQEVEVNEGTSGSAQMVEKPVSVHATTSLEGVDPRTELEVMADSFLQSPETSDQPEDLDMREEVLRENLEQSLLDDQTYASTLQNSQENFILDVDDVEPPKSPTLGEQPGLENLQEAQPPPVFYPMPPPPPQQHIRFHRVRVPYPFLEEIRRDLFTTQVRPTDLRRLYDIDQIPPQHRTEYLQMIKHSRQSTSEIRSSRRIVELIEINVDARSRWFFPTYKVRREGGSVWTFGEPDLMHLNISDFNFLYDRLAREPNKNKLWYDAFDVVKRHMKNLLRLAYLTDFQIALESECQLNRYRPNLHVRDIESLIPYKVLLKPEHGVVYRNYQVGKLRFLRFSEINKFSDGTLQYILDQLKPYLLRHQSGIYPMSPVDVMRTEKAIKLIEERLDYRNVLRSFEVKFGMRRKIVPEEERLAILASRRH